MSSSPKVRVARYVGNGQVAIVEEDRPVCPEGGLLVETLASGLCSGELMDWYMDRKVPHVLGHEVAARVVESQDARFPVGAQVFPHHHAPCLACELCQAGKYVHCEQWRRTKLQPGGMADVFAVPAANLSDTLQTDDLRPVDAALIEPLACVAKSLRLSGSEGSKAAVVGLGVMGLMHLLLLPRTAKGYDLNSSRVEWARSIGLDAGHPNEATPADVVFVCPGSQAAFDFAMSIVEPEGTIVMFAPLSPGQSLQVPQEAYFRDIAIRNSYSCGPNDTRAAAQAIRDGKLRAEQVVSNFIGIEELPEAYLAMKKGEILKPMVVFG
jgi:L-iditol 2-dehydrogenase